MLTVNYDINPILRYLLGCQTTSYLVLTNLKKSNCRLFASILKVTAVVNVLTNLLLKHYNAKHKGE